MDATTPSPAVRFRSSVTAPAPAPSTGSAPLGPCRAASWTTSPHQEDVYLEQVALDHRVGDAEREEEPGDGGSLQREQAARGRARTPALSFLAINEAGIPPRRPHAP